MLATFHHTRAVVANATASTIRQHHYFIHSGTGTNISRRQQSLLPMLVLSKLIPIPSNIHQIYRSMSANAASSSSTPSPSSSSSSSSSPVRYPHDLFAWVDRRFGDLITEYPDIKNYAVTATGSHQHSLIWFRVPDESESEREVLREADRRALAEGKWKRPYAHLIEAGRDINSATGVKFGTWGPNKVCNFDSPLSHIECYRLVFTSDVKDPRPWSNDWTIQSVIGYNKMPTEEELQSEKNGYERALG